MALADAIPTLRTFLTDNLTDTCTIYRPGAPGRFNTATGAYASATSDTALFSAIDCLVRPKMDETVGGGGLQTAVGNAYVYLAHTRTGIRTGDRVDVTASGYDADLVDDTWRVVTVEADGHGVRRRLEVTRDRGGRNDPPPTS